jgi:hypothetical protein
MFPGRVSSFILLVPPGQYFCIPLFCDASGCLFNVWVCKSRPVLVFCSEYWLLGMLRTAFGFVVDWRIVRCLAIGYRFTSCHMLFCLRHSLLYVSILRRYDNAIHELALYFNSPQVFVFLGLDSQYYWAQSSEVGYTCLRFSAMLRLRTI